MGSEPPQEPGNGDHFVRKQRGSLDEAVIEEIESIEGSKKKYQGGGSGGGGSLGGGSLGGDLSE